VSRFRSCLHWLTRLKHEPQALYRATGGDAWHRREGWGTAHVDLSKWCGVRLDRPGPQGRLLALSLHRNNLRGEIPREFVEAMDALGVVPGLWGNPELSGMPKKWEEQQGALEEEAWLSEVGM
jgi:hypothetical protein